MTATTCPSVFSTPDNPADPPPVEITVTSAAVLDEDSAISSLASWLLQLAECEEAVEENVTI